MVNYQSFVDHLKEEYNAFSAISRENWEQKAYKYINGVAADELRRLVKLDLRRQFGAFFTNSDLAQKVILHLKPTLTEKSVIYDPACGAGNLLIAVANALYDLFPGIDATTNLFGTDIHGEFVEASKIRLKINALLNNVRIEEPELNDASNLLKQDGLLSNKFYNSATHIVANPPFNLIDSDKSIKWAKGKVSAAAVFIDKIIANVAPDTSIIAILPDVLRSGSRYAKWRNMVEENCVVNNKVLLGQFDKYADIDVFLLILTKKGSSTETQTQKHIQNEKDNCKKIEDQFDVCVGPVVDNRDKIEGRKRGYVVSKGLKGWHEVKNFDKTRQYSGKSFKSPFVVIKRTSRIGDTYRAIATIVNSKNPVYVDNHLIVLLPKSNSIIDCQNILEVLKDKRTNNWLNEQIRCRHLTVKIVSQIPL